MLVAAATNNKYIVSNTCTFQILSFKICLVSNFVLFDHAREAQGFTKDLNWRLVCLAGKAPVLLEVWVRFLSGPTLTVLK